ncbi:short-chain dehydrogenase [Hysterangium stoloniferum]|nr:short-chain dehydrogenase [Hysterangium stoloniferum]
MTLSGITRYYQEHFSTLPAVSELKKDLHGKTVIVTGANSGVGLETARHLAGMGPGRLILGCRNMDKAESARADIIRTTGIDEGVIETWHLDLAMFSSVSAFADRYEKEGGGHLDLLVMNAAAQGSTPIYTEDGWETLLQVNHLSTWLLTFLLFPYLVKARPSGGLPRIVLVGSEAHYYIWKVQQANDPPILDKLNDKTYCMESWVMMLRYPITKREAFNFQPLANNAPVVSVVLVTPGWCKTNLPDLIAFYKGYFARVAENVFGRSAEMGSRAVLWSALTELDENQASLHGRYTTSCRITEESSYSLSDEGMSMQEHIWEETLEILQQKDDRISSILKDYLGL